MKNVKKSVLIGLSGGVDSAVAALILKRKGYNVIGAFMKNYSSKNKNSLINMMCWQTEKKSAEKVATQLDIPLIILDFEKEYREKVINPLFEGYKRGLTPNPDTLCNKIVKFPLLWKEAKKLKIDYISTGHYARIKKDKEGFNLYSGIDNLKDQTYFLYQLTQKDLSHTLFPLGNLTKKEVRKIAEKNKLHNASKPGTKGICFVGNVDMRTFLKQKIKEKKGDILDFNGNIVGIHPGIMYFTIGQRIGPRLGFEFKKGFTMNQRWYISSKNKKTNTITIAPEGNELLTKKEIKITKFNKINPKEKIPKTGLKATIRHLGKYLSGKLIVKEKSISFIFDKPERAIAEGQAIVIHHNDKIIGGGEIRL